MQSHDGERLCDQNADEAHARRVFRASKFAFVDTLVVVLKDVKWFLIFLVFTMWVRAAAADARHGPLC